MKTQQQKLSQYAKDNHVPVMMEDGLAFLLDQVRQAKVKNFLEIGTAIGKTAIAVASLDPEIQVVTIERDPKMIEAAKINIAESGLASQITLIEGDANEALPDFLADCIFIDAAKAQYQRFFAKYSPILSRNGIILSDNMNFHGMVDHPERTNNRNTKHLLKKIRMYREFLKSLEDFETTFMDVGDGVEYGDRKDAFERRKKR